MEAMKNIEETAATCDGCGLNCPLTAPRCGRGAAQAREQGIEVEEGSGGHRGRQAGDDEAQGREGRSSHGRQGQGRRGGQGRGSRGGQGHHGGRGGQGRCGGRHGHHGPAEHGEGLESVDDRLAHVFHHCARMLVHRDPSQGGRSAALAILGRHGAMTQASLADRLGIRAASASELVAKLESDALVTREKSSDDGRAYCLQLTDEGRKMAEEAFAERRERDARLFSALDDEEKEELAGLLHKLARSWHR